MTLPATGCLTRLLIMNEIDYKKLFTEARRYFSLEWDYTKLTAVEKMAVLLSAVAFVAVVIIIGTFVLHHLFTALISVLASALGCAWGAHLIAAALLLLLLLVVLAFKKQLIVDPVTRFVSKLFLKPEDNE